MTLLIASDHAGFDLKEDIKRWLDKSGVVYTDVGTHSAQSCDYPQIVEQMMHAFHKDHDLGILICGSGHGVCIAANRFSGIRAILARTPEDAHMGRLHNHANVICLGQKYTTVDEAYVIVDRFLKTQCDEAERHERRVKQVDGLCDIKGT